MSPSVLVAGAGLKRGGAAVLPTTPVRTPATEGCAVAKAGATAFGANGKAVEVGAAANCLVGGAGRGTGLERETRGPREKKEGGAGWEAWKGSEEDGLKRGGADARGAAAAAVDEPEDGATAGGGATGGATGLTGEACAL